MRSLSSRQIQLHRFIVDYFQFHHQSPRLVDMARSLGTSTRAALDILRALERKGFIMTENGTRVVQYVLINKQYSPVASVPLDETLNKTQSAYFIDTGNTNVQAPAYSHQNAIPTGLQTQNSNRLDGSSTDPGFKAVWYQASVRLMDSIIENNFVHQNDTVSRWLLFALAALAIKGIFGGITDKIFVIVLALMWVFSQIQSLIERRKK